MADYYALVKDGYIQRDVDTNMSAIFEMKIQRLSLMKKERPLSKLLSANRTESYVENSPSYCISFLRGDWRKIET